MRNQQKELKDEIQAKNPTRGKAQKKQKQTNISQSNGAVE